jgi:uncharacterized protein YciI
LVAHTLKLLLYDYVDDILERRGPLRPAHLALLGDWAGDGRLLAGGPTGDPPTGAMFIFRASTDPEEFAAADPYVREGLVTSWRVETWTNVTGDL